MAERILLFGADDSLGGILSGPETQSASAPRILFLSPGKQNHNGPGGLYHEIAKEFAKEEAHSFRLDLTNLSEELRASAVKLAVDSFGSEVSTGPLVFFGVGGGADLAIRSAADDERIRGLVLIDGPGYPDFRFRVRRAMSGGYLAKPRRAAQTKTGSGGSAAFSGLHRDERNFPDRKTMAETLQKITERGTELLVIFTESSSSYANTPQQFFRNFPGDSIRARTTVEFFPGADSAFSFLAGRAELLRVTKGWLSSRLTSKHQ